MDMKRNWKKALLSSGATLKQVISNLNETAFQIVMVVSNDNRLLGTVTDGDIRRGLLRGLDLSSQIESVMNRDVFAVLPTMDRDLVLHLMKANRVHQLPIVDVERKVVGLHLWDELLAPTVRPNTMVIMAGGLGTRLHPYTEGCPKPLLAVAGKPILEHIIERAKMNGFSHFVIAVYYLSHMIEDYFGNGERWQVNIEYLRESAPLGTAGALCLLKTSQDKPFLVSNGDILTDICYGELLDFHICHNALATMAVRKFDWRNPFGVVKTNGVDIIGFEEKPIISTHVNAGVYVIDPHALRFLDDRKSCDMPLLFERLRSGGMRTVAYPIHEAWLDVGSPDEYKRAQDSLIINNLEDQLI